MRGVSVVWNLLAVALISAIISAGIGAVMKDDTTRKSILTGMVTAARDITEEAIEGNIYAAAIGGAILGILLYVTAKFKDVLVATMLIAVIAAGLYFWS